MIDPDNEIKPEEGEIKPLGNDPEERCVGRMPDDCSDDAEALASAGFGTDEDYGYEGYNCCGYEE
jgi:hypothetical protein